MGRCILSAKSLKFHFAIRRVYPLEGKIFLSEEKHSRPRKSSLMTTGTFCGRLYIHSFFLHFSQLPLSMEFGRYSFLCGANICLGGKIKKERRGHGVKTKKGCPQAALKFWKGFPSGLAFDFLGGNVDGGPFRID